MATMSYLSANCTSERALMRSATLCSQNTKNAHVLLLTSVRKLVHFFSFVHKDLCHWWEIQILGTFWKLWIIAKNYNETDFQKSLSILKTSSSKTKAFFSEFLRFNQSLSHEVLQAQVPACVAVYTCAVQVIIHRNMMRDNYICSFKPAKNELQRLICW